MAERRMMAKSIIKSDQFLDMPATTQNLYFHMLLDADDDGFINAPKSIMRVIGAKEDDMKLLIAKQFVIGFGSGVIVIKHWKIHNYIQSDRYKPSLQPERRLIDIKANKEYMLKSDDVSILDTECIQSVSILDTECIQSVSIGKVSLDKVSLDKVSLDKVSLDNKNCRLSDKSSTVVSEIIDYLNQKTGKHFRKSIANTTRAINARSKEGFTADDFKAVIDKKVIEWGKDERMKQYLRPQTLFGTKFESYLNQDLVEHKSQTDKAIDVAKNVIEYYQEREGENGKDGYGESFSTVTDRF